MSEYDDQELPLGWSYCRIGDVVAFDGLFVDGDWVESKDQDPNGDVRLIQLADVGDGLFHDKSARFLTTGKAYELNCTFLKQGDLLVARMPDPLGRCCIFPLEGKEKYVTVVDVCAVRLGSSQFDAKYMMYLINSPATRAEIAALQSGSTRKRISRKNLATIQMPCAPEKEQQRIVAKIEELFSELDNGIESLKTARVQLKIYRQAVLKHAFEGKLTKKWREENTDNLETADLLLARITQEQEARYELQLERWKAAVREWEEHGKQGKKPSKPSKAKIPPPISPEEQSRLPRLPDEWTWVRLANLFSATPQNGLYKPANEYGNGAQIIRIDDFYDGKLIRKTGFKRLRLNDEEAKKYCVNNADLLINRVNSIEYLGKCALVAGLSEPTVFESNIMKCQLLDDLISKAYVTAYLASHHGRNRLCENAKHAVNQASINQTDVSNTPVPLAPLGEQAHIAQEIERKLSQSDALMSEIESHLARAEALRQSILKKALSGQLVKQDPNDEPASVLLERIQAEKDQQEKNTKKNKNKRKDAA